ncbi:MAG TPA: iron-sulfur cluster repair di-iron protein [Caulobacteraceae bacterium]|nr:iron-sulfur cluster repair di-iron protein [Caulobacteraceae bacterium]
MATTVTALRDRTVGDIAAHLAGATAIFRRHRIDFCCGGDVKLAEAAARGGLHVGDLEAALGALAAAAPEAPQESAALVAHIRERFHETHRRELPELVALARRVEATHRGHPEAPRGLTALLERAASELEDHMAKEEQVLFPAMQADFRGSLDMPIRVMRQEHDGHAQIVHALEALTGRFTLPANACRSWQALYAGAEKFVTDLTEHIHLENNVLFPRFERRWS